MCRFLWWCYALMWGELFLRIPMHPYPLRRSRFSFDTCNLAQTTSTLSPLCCWVVVHCATDITSCNTISLAATPPYLTQQTHVQSTGQRQNGCHPHVGVHVPTRCVGPSVHAAVQTPCGHHGPLGLPGMYAGGGGVESLSLWEITLAYDGPQTFASSPSMSWLHRGLTG